MKSPLTFIVAGVVLLAAVVLIVESTYVLTEAEQAVITEFGEPIGDSDVTEAGLQFKLPFVQKVHRFEKRALEFDGDPDELVTKDKKLIYIDTFARWRIANPRTFLKAVTNEIGAQARLDDIIDSATRTAIANHRLIEAVRNSNAPLAEDPDILEARQRFARQAPVAPGVVEGPAEVVGDSTGGGEDLVIEKGREQIRQEILDDAKTLVSNLGIELIDVQIKRINYIEAVERRVVDRMKSDREQIAELLRSEGLERREEILGDVGRTKNEILSEAYRKAEEIRGAAEAEAARVYAEAYGRDPEFFRFWKTLELYRNTLGANTSLVLGTDSAIFRVLRDGGVLAAEASAD